MSTTACGSGYACLGLITDWAQCAGARRQAKNNNHALIGTGSKEDQGLLVNHPPIDTPLVVPQQYRFSCQLAPPDAHEQMIELESQAARSYMLGSPNTDHLLTLSRLNIQHAINHNIVSIGMTREWLKCDESISIFNVLTPGFSEERIPTSLHPTALQRTKPHHPWLDAFPFPQMRDNLIAVEDEMDDDGLCRDLMAFWDTRNAGAMLLVWGDAWDPRNWEVTEEFLWKWGWVVQGCKEIVESTNAWRRLRGERKVVWNG